LIIQIQIKIRLFYNDGKDFIKTINKPKWNACLGNHQYSFESLVSITYLDVCKLKKYDLLRGFDIMIFCLCLLIQPWFMIIAVFVAKRTDLYSEAIRIVKTDLNL